MKKLFTLLTLLVALITSAWADVPSPIYYKVFPSGVTYYAFTADNASAAVTAKWMNSGYGTNSKKGNINPATGASVSATAYNGIAVKGTDAGVNKTCVFYITGVTELVVYGVTTSGSDTRTIWVVATPTSGSEVIGSANSEPNKTASVTVSLDATKQYKIQCYGTASSATDYTGSGGDCGIHGFKVTAAVPNLSGTWKVGDDVVTGQTTNIVKDAAATAPTFVVGASAGTPTTDDYTVAYSLKAGSKAGIFTYTAAGGVSAINTSVEGTATIVATLTTKDAKKFQTPATNTFEYTVTIAAAAAPVFTVTGSESAVRGDALQLTANVTAGNPTPTIQWFSSDDDASITNPEAQGEAGTDKLTFDVPTTTVGVYYYFAVANNGIGGDGAHDVFSDIKTITVKPKSPTITSSVKFGSSIKVFIKKADGEDAEAVIKYKKGNGEWQDYPDGDTGIELSATTTVYAKVVQEDIESAVVSATYYTTASFAAGKEYITFASPYALDCTTANLPAGLKAYKATGASASSVTIEEVNSTVTAGTGLLLQRTGDTSAAGNFNIPVVVTGTNISGSNKFVGVTAAAGAAIGGDGKYDYVLKNGQFHHASSGTLAQGKAYLHLDAAPAAPVLTIDFGDVTGISQIENGELIIENVFDLQGRKVAQPTKGLYIVNGRKVVIK